MLFSDLPDILGLLGVDMSTHTLYAVSKDHHLITSNNPDGGGWQYFKRSEWDEAKGKISMVKMTTLPLVPQQDEIPEKILKQFLDSNGDRWKGTKVHTLNPKYSTIILDLTIIFDFFQLSLVLIYCISTRVEIGKSRNYVTANFPC